MDRLVVMVDAGYFLRQSIEIVSGGASTVRRDLEITDAAGLIDLLVAQSRTALATGRELLRVYWYDGVLAGGLTPQQRQISELPDVNFRAGLVNSRGQQKGVDSLIVTDLIELASNHAVADAALVTGDSDLAIGIELAQKKGVRIAVIGLEDLAAGVSSSQSREITDRADRVIRFGGAALRPFMRYRVHVPSTLAGSASSAGPPLSSASRPAPRPAPRPAAGSASAAPRPAVGSAGPAAATVAVSVPPAGPPAPPRAYSQAPLTSAGQGAIDNAVAAFIAATATTAAAVDASTKRIDAAVDRALIHHVYTTLALGALTISERSYARTSFRKQLGV